MFWRFGGYANISAIDTILDKPEFTLEELLDESDLIQELKQHNAKLIDYLRDEKILERLLEYVVAPRLEPVASVDDDQEDDADTSKGKGRALPFSRPRASSRATDDSETREEEAEKKRNRYAYVAAEILSSDNWSICEALMASTPMLKRFWQFLKRESPLDPLQASYFTKVNESLFDKKTEEMVDLLKSVDGAVPDMLRHVDCPMIMDLLLKIISLERTESGQGIVEWLYTQDVMPALLSFLSPEHSWATQTSAGDFMKAIITVSANASQNEQTCIGPNELTRQLVSRECVEQLIGYMLGGGNALTVGVGIVIEVIRKNNSDYDPDVGAEANSAPSSHDPIYLGTLLRLFAEHVPDFMHLIMHAPAGRERLDSTFGDKIEPLGFDRFKTCELMAELLHCSNMGLLNEVGSEELIAVRDVERERLRIEGKLSSIRAEDPPSHEDLTMRRAYSSPVEEGRRLEVTNVSDDDGFEQVTRSAEMTEDTSHEFVKAEEEISAGSGSTASFLDKDEDDFVDEPLSSPRLHVRDPVDEPQFDEPDLVVAPLSPSKQKAAQLDKPEAPGSSKPEEKSSGMEESDVVFTPTISSIAGSDTADAKPSAPEASQREPSADAKDDFAAEVVKPAPLFSAKTKALEATREAGEAGEAEAKEDTPADNETDTGDASIIVGHAPDEPPTPMEDAPVAPVVGDFLKVQFVEHQVVPAILSFFFKYPWNNFLHNVVYDIVQQVFNGPMDRGYNPTLAISLFERADVTSQIINGQLASEESQQKSRTRMGYMGHLTLIAEEVVKFTERHPPELLSETVLDRVMSQDWINYVEGPLAETRERDNAILGGVRPEVAMSNRAAGSGLAAVGLSSLGSALSLTSSQGSGLAEAGLTGGVGDAGDGGGNGIGPFAISAGTMMSGFGSSSDEDEDEEVDNEEDVNNEFRAYTDPLNASNSSMNPPSIPPPPPPPPPLNVPPSRARLQFAARLAMSKRRAEGQDTGNGDDSEDKDDLSSLAAPAPPETLRDPFADYDDEEDEDRVHGAGSDDEDRPDLDDGSRGSGWNRGAWWRGVVHRRDKQGPEKDSFGDGRDSDEEGNSSGEDEFGDFAMPEVDSSRPAGAGQEGETLSSSPDSDKGRDKVLLKPLPVHPPQGGSSKTSAFSSLWPFSNQPFGLSGSKDKDKKGGGGDEAAAAESQAKSDEAASAEDPDVVVGEDGNKVERAVKAQRRTSIEEPDEDEEADVVRRQ